MTSRNHQPQTDFMSLIQHASKLNIAEREVFWTWIQQHADLDEKESIIVKHVLDLQTLSWFISKLRSCMCLAVCMI